MRKKAFTLVEILIVMAIAIPIVAGLSAIFLQIHDMYDDVQALTEQNGHELDYIYDISMLLESADYVSVEDGYITVWKDGVAVPLDKAKYEISGYQEESSGGVYVRIWGGGVFWLRTIPEED